jgi:hypothetical protein
MVRTVAALLSLSLGLVPATAQNLGVSLVNGVDGYAVVPYTPAVVPQSGITFEAWITYDDATLPTGWRYPTVCRQNVTPQQESYFLRIEAGNTGSRTLRWKVVTDNGTQLFCSWTFATGQMLAWTHVAGTYDGTSAKLYVNGALVSTSTATGNGRPIWDRGGDLRIGKGDDTGGPIEVWNGEIDEVRLWPFARTAAEIQATMNWSLAGIPGHVSTFGLDGHLIDTSGGLVGTAVGTLNFAPNTLVLPAAPGAPVTTAGASTPGCLGALRATVASLPQAGNAAFGPVCTRAPANAVAFLAVAFTAAPVALPIAGIDYWLDLGSTSVVLTGADALGAAKYTVALPAWLPVGQSLAFQYGFFDACGPQGLTASDAVVVSSF